MSILDDVNEALGGPQETSDLIPSDDMHIIDGDTIRIKSTGENVRTYGIDTPEKSNRYRGTGPQIGAADATENLRQFAKDGLRLQRTDDKGVFGRSLAKFQSPDGQDYGSGAVAAGHAYTSAYTPGEYELEKQKANDKAFSTPLDGAYRKAMSDLSQREYAAAGPRLYNADDTFATSIARGGKNLKAMSYGFLNAVAGFTNLEGMEKWSEDGMEQALSEAFLNPPEIRAWDDVHTLGNFGTFVVEKIGEQVPQLGADLAAFAFTGGVGSVAMSGARRAAVGKAAKRIVGEASYDKWKKDFVYDSRFSEMVKYGKPGAMASIYSQTSGETQVQLKENGVDSPGTALLAGIPKTALEYMSLKLMVGNTARILGMDANKFSEVLLEVGKRAGISMASEGATEGLQTLIDQVATTIHTGGDIWTDEFISELKTAVAAGTVVGGGFSVVGGARNVAEYGYNKFTGKNQNDTENPDARNPDGSVSGPSGTGGKNGAKASAAGAVSGTVSAESEETSGDYKRTEEVAETIAERARSEEDYLKEDGYTQEWVDKLLGNTETSGKTLTDEELIRLQMDENLTEEGVLAERPKIAALHKKLDSLEQDMLDRGEEDGITSQYQSPVARNLIADIKWLANIIRKVVTQGETVKVSKKDLEAMAREADIAAKVLKRATAKALAVREIVEANHKKALENMQSTLPTQEVEVEVGPVQQAEPNHELVQAAIDVYEARMDSDEREAEQHALKAMQAAKARMDKLVGRVLGPEKRAERAELNLEQEAWSQASSLERNPLEEEAIQNAEDERMALSDADADEAFGNTDFSDPDSVAAAIAAETTHSDMHIKHELGERPTTEAGVASEINTEDGSSFKARRPFEFQKRIAALLGSLIPTMDFTVLLNKDYSKGKKKWYRITAKVNDQAEVDYTSDPEVHKYRTKFLAALHTLLDDGDTAVRHKERQKTIMLSHPDHGKFPIHAGRLTSLGMEIYAGDYDQANYRQTQQRAFYDGLGELLMLGFTFSEKEADLAYKNIAADKTSKVQAVSRKKPGSGERALRETENPYVAVDYSREANEGRGDAEQGTVEDELAGKQRKYHDAVDKALDTDEELPTNEPQPDPRKYDNYAPEMSSEDAYLSYPNTRQAPFQNITTDNQTGEVTSSGLYRALKSIVKQFGADGLKLPRIVQVTTKQMKLLNSKGPKAFITSHNGAPILYIDSRKHINQRDFERTLKHEVIAHYGWRVAVSPKDRRKILAAIKGSKKDFLKNEWAHVEKTYPDATSDVQAEEVLALIAEDLNLEKHGVGKKLKHILMSILRKLGMAPSRITRKQLQELLASIAKGTIEQRTPEVQLVRELSHGFDRADVTPSQTWQKAKDFWGNRGEYFGLIKFFATADRRLRQINVQLAEMFNEQVQGGRAGKERGYTQAKSNGVNRWVGQWKLLNRNLKEKYTEAQIAEGTRILRQADEETTLKNPVAQELHKFMRTMFVGYLKPRMPTLGFINNYFPRVYDIVEARERSGELAKIFEKHAGLRPDQAKGVVEAILETDDGFTDVLDDLVNKSVGPNTWATKERTLNGEGLNKALENQGFTFSDTGQIMEHYIGGMVKRAEFHKTFGGYRVIDSLIVNEVGDELTVELDTTGLQGFLSLAKAAGFPLTEDTYEDVQRAIDQRYMRLGRKDNKLVAEWFSPTYKQNKMLDHIEQTKGTFARQEAQLIIDAYMGRLGLDLDPKLRKGMSYAMLTQTYLTLAFSAVASIPDFAGALIRTREIDVAWKALKTSMAQMQKAEQKEMYEIIGLVNQRMTHQQLLEMFGQNHADPTVQKYMEKFFKWNGQEWLTDRSRIFAYEVGRAFIEMHGRKHNKRSKKYLEQLHLDQDTVKRWLDAGKPVWSIALADSNKDAAIVAKRVQEALYQFVDESVIRPNAAQRPVAGSNPAYMLVWHLKSFFYSYGKQIIWPMARETIDRYQNGERKMTLAEPIAMGAMTLLPMAALALELRELLKFDDEEEALSNRLDGLEYTQELLSRSGVYGPFEIIIGLAGGYGDPAARTAHALGPAIDHAVTLAGTVVGDTKLSEALFRSIPGVSQNLFNSRDLARELYSDIGN